MTPTQTGDEILLIVFLLTCAATILYWLIDLWTDSRLSDVWRTVYGDYRCVRAQRRAERQARREMELHPNVVLRIRASWEAKR
jgi:hypothetical protein